MIMIIKFLWVIIDKENKMFFFLVYMWYKGYNYVKKKK